MNLLACIGFITCAICIFSTDCKLINVFDDGQLHPSALIPDITSIIEAILPTAFFYDQNRHFRRATTQLKEILLGIDDPMDFMGTVQALRNNSDVHPSVLMRAALGAIINRNDRAEFRIPSLLEALPDMALPAQVMSQIQDQMVMHTSQRQCVVVDEFSGATDRAPENALWYFRQDPLINSHHWFWHLVYKFDSLEPRDRRGELFYSMHHSVLNRFHADRLSNMLPPVVPFAINKGAFISEGYDSQLTETNAKQNWADRSPWRMLSNTVETSFANLTVDEIVNWRTRMLNSIHAGYLLLANGSTLPVRNVGGIDAISNTVEASAFNVNPAYYGGFGYHNGGHILIGNVMHPHDPQSVHPPGVMSDTATAMRDPVFYRWHLGIDKIFLEHKATLAPYQPSGGELPLAVPGLYVESVQVRTKSLTPSPANLLRTFWSYTTYNLTNGLDFKRNETNGQGPVQVCIKHLNHQNFEYKISVRNTKAPTKATVRIFLAPRYSYLGLRYTMEEQHKLFFEMDTFTVNLATGSNPITRQSIDSSLTITLNQGVDELNEDQTRSRVYCGCGWPHYMLLPKGRPGTGMVFDLVVMVTQDGDSSSIPASPPPPAAAGDAVSECQQAYLFCGVFHSKYPDPRPMGYPFDRLPYAVRDYLLSLPLPWLPPISLGQYTRVVRDLDEYMRPVPNMGATQVRIVHVENPGAARAA